MCLLIFAHRVWPGHPLVLAANRDEFYGRETTASNFWSQYPNVLAGRDLRAGGTWMGVTRQGRFAAITNYRDPGAGAIAERSRGELTLDFLTGSATPSDYLHEVGKNGSQYAGFNLLLGDGKAMWHYSNRNANTERQPNAPEQLEPGVYGLSNASLDTPWPKVELGKKRLNQLLPGAPPSHDALLSLVGDRRQASNEELQLSGLEGEMDQLLSSQFIMAGEYGTRSSTTLWTDDNSSLNWRELSFDTQGKIAGTASQQFILEDG
jgi:uncharacterized protein with NRDE domain